SEKVELKTKIAELLKQVVKESKRCDVENAELRARIEELNKNKTVTTKLKSKNAKFRNRIIKISKANSHYKKSLVNKKIDTSLPKELILKHDQIFLEDKKINAFLNEMYKKKISDKIRQCNREKKLQAQPCNSASLEASANSDDRKVFLEKKTNNEQNLKYKKEKSVNKLKQE
ncbi:2757_t:CDS:2, partial [Cetraspora pellucida]